MFYLRMPTFSNNRMQNLGFRLRRLLPPSSAATSCCLRLPLTVRLFHRLIRTPSARLQHTSGAQSQHQQQDQHLPEPTVRVAQGLVRGRRAVSKQGGSYLSFQGLPYAEPPLGPLRFKPPQPPQPWGGELAALQPLPKPLQKSGGSEDCLYLNVYTPQADSTVRLPVMVWLFGGRFQSGSGNSDLYGPDYLVDAGVVLVTLNYRLSVLGFLNVGNAGAAGNMGLKDQVAALRWVRENIGAFGGDRDNVTIFGESSGAACVTYHMISDMSKGLFHKAIAQSGSCLGPGSLTREPRARAFRLGELLGCRTEDERQLMDCLMAADADTLVKHAERVLPRTQSIAEMNYTFGPSLEPRVEGEKQFLTEHPECLLEKGNIHQIPFISGIVENEGTFALRGFLEDPSIFSVINKSFHMVMPSTYKDGFDAQELDVLCNRIKSFYFKSQPLTRENFAMLNQFLGDLRVIGIYIFAKQLSATSSAPVFFYNFSFDGELGFAKRAMARLRTNISGAHHGDDIGYLFRMGLHDPDVESNSPEARTRDLMVKLWTDFAKTGNPTPQNGQDIPVTWTPFNQDNESYLRIGKQPRLEEQLWKDRMTFLKNALYSSVRL